MVRVGRPVCRYSDHNAEYGSEETPLSEPFPQDEPEQQAEFLRNRLFDRLADNREDGPIATADLWHLLNLLDATDRPERRASVIAEIGITERLLALGAHLRVEVPNAEGRSADLEVRIDGVHFFLHIKRMPNPPADEPAVPPLPALLRELESLERPYRVAVHCREELTEAELSRVHDELHGFLLAARIGDRRIIRDDEQRTLADAVVVAPSEDTSITLTRGEYFRAEAGFANAHRLLCRAYRQFVPGAENVTLLIGGGPYGGHTMELALLGSHVERWDRLPRQHQIVAHGRAGDGLWSANRYERSHIAAWLQDPFADGRIWTREKSRIAPRLEHTLRTLLDVNDE
ncbi:MAG: hypothetical protein MK085_05915 [Phycisphaerales bacterium]|nr:hypothetical protein [Phycisphaerales bacterium]